MDAYEVTRVVYSRVQAMEPDHASKIMGYLLLQDGGDEEMFRLAFSHEAVLQALVLKVKKDLGLMSAMQGPATAHLPSVRNSQLYTATGLQQQQQHSFLQQSAADATYGNGHSHGHLDDRFMLHSDQAFLNGGSQTASLRFNNSSVINSSRLEHSFLRSNDLQQQQQHAPFSVDPSTYFDDYGSFQQQQLQHEKPSFDSFHRQFNGRRFSPAEQGDGALPLASPWKPCLYYARGYCKHGSGCKFLHSLQVRPTDVVGHPFLGNDSGSDDGILTGSLERLELEILELLRGRKAPISIAALPQLYYERFGKTLQADGYLTESQRHGKAGYSLTKLLARMKNSVTLIDSICRPHGQHAVVVAEDAFKFTAFRSGEKDDLNGYNPGSRQIYLTFPADSAFTEDDVSSYFRIYGPVQDVRIPFQQKRMFGFVTFVYPETVKIILGKGNPHFICGATVLVKPYKEKGNKHTDRKFPDHTHPGFLTGQSTEFDSIRLPGQHQQLFFEHDSFRRLFEDPDLALEMEKLRFSDPRFQHEQFSQMWKQHHHHAGELLFPDSSLSLHSSTSSAAISIPMSQSLDHPLFQSAASNGNSPSEKSVVSSEGLKPIQTNGNLQGTSGNNSEEEHDHNAKERNDRSSDEHNLPDSPFTSPHKPFSPLPTDKSITVSLPFVNPSQTSANNMNCHICNDFSLDPLQLDCGHAFCFECILKVVRVSKDECPICHKDIGSQAMKLIDTRRPEVVDTW